MKKVFCIMLALFMLTAVFAGCTAAPTTEAPAAAEAEAPAAAEEAPAAAEEAPAEGAKTFTIGYLGWDVGQAWNTYTLGGLQYGAELCGCEVVVMDAKLNAEDQVTQAEQLINQGVDCMAIFPVTPDAAATVVRMANEAGIPIAVDNTFIAEDAGDMVGQVACQYGDIGYAAIKWAAENVADAKLFYCQGGPGEGVYEAYQVGVDQALADFSDKITCVGGANGEWTTDASYNVTADFISGGTEFNVIFANNDAQAKGCFNALKDAGISNIPIISTGGSPEGYDMLVAGEESANMTAPANLQGLIEFGMLWAHMNGTTWGEAKIPLPVVPIDANNIDEWIFWDNMEMGYAWVCDNIGPYNPAPAA